MIRQQLAGLLGGAIVAGAVALASRTPADEKYMRVEDVKPGMKGYGLTVLSGSVPERFEIEVISTLHGFRPGQDLVLIKTPHPRLQIARTVAGMSGSPIYIEGKMIGAYAYGWFFNVEPIAGVTPIHNMLDDLKRPVPPSIWPDAPRAAGARVGGGALLLGPGPWSPGPAGMSSPLPTGPGRKPDEHSAGSGNRFALGTPGSSRGVLDYDLDEHVARIGRRAAAALQAPEGTTLAPATTDLIVGGLGDQALAFARRTLEPAGFTVLQAGGAGAPPPQGGPEGYVDGGVITVTLVRGDVSVSGLGTVTHVVGDKLVAFGHPMIQGGIENLPTALGHVHWILSTQNRSFKIGEPTKSLGALVNDRQASIVVHTARNSPVFPITVDVAGSLGAPKTHWEMEVAHDPFFAPQFAALGVGSVLETTTAERNDMTWRAKSKLTLARYGSIELDDFGSGTGSPIGPNDFARSRLVQAMGVLLNNPWEEVQVERVVSKVDVVHKRETFQLRGSQVLDPELDPGEPARIRLTLEPYLGVRETRVIEVPIPAVLAGQEVRIRLKPGYTEERMLPAPESVAELVAMLPRLAYPGESLLAMVELPDEAGAAYRGRVAERLPPFAADVLRPTAQSVAPEMFTAQETTVIPLKGFIIGDDSVTVKVREVVR